MGQVASMIARRANRFNAENRAHRIIEREKPTPAPKFDSNLRDMERTLELDPKFVDKLNLKDSTLDTRLKDVYVTSQDRFIARVQERQAAESAADTAEQRPLPLERQTPDDYEYGYKEPNRVLTGHCSLRQALKFINDHQIEPELWPAKKIADEYKLKETNVENILHYFKTFNVYIPDQKYKDTLLTQAKQKINLLKEKTSVPDSSS
ncbi:protein NDUFAF4 homolog [Drosophila pseudoobscura]|uniref:Protein NDUFAF4 homolog n=1 Tax=Drosophila pseudoobscura pseudoobscura TaxID=46245 RepID=A0A6I8UMQ5_DROPS|nr:protein NDUFAF4 homolog [Drosophila pseudoobscura]